MTLTNNKLGAPQEPGLAVPSDFLRVPEVARRLGVAKSILYEWLQRGEIAYHRFGTRIRIREADIAHFLARTRREARPSSYARCPSV